MDASVNAEYRNTSLDSCHDPTITSIIPNSLAADSSLSNIFAQTSLSSITKVENEPCQVQGYPSTLQKNVFPTSIQSPIPSQNQSGSLSNNRSEPSRRTGNGRPKF